MSKNNVALKNGAMGLVSQLVTLLFTFVTRNLFIKYIGVEILGLNSTFTSILSTLSLAEMGFQSAIVYSLYKPLHEKDTDSIIAVMNIFKLIYRVIGIFFVVGSFALLPFLKYILKGIQISLTIYVYFLLQATTSSSSYFLAYKRAILYADQKEYVSKTIDMSVNVVSNILQCIALGVFHSYVGFLVIRILQSVVSNLFVHDYCNRHYSYLCPGPVDRKKLKEIFSNVKSIFTARIASYIYTSTDNLLVSTFIGTVSVGFLTNYTTITTSLKSLTNSMLSPIIPSIGKFLIAEQDSVKRENTLLFFTHIRFVVAVLLLVPLLVLIDTFITWWVGADMVQTRMISYLLVADLYIHLVHSATDDFINGAGLFHSARNISIAGAVSNLVSSLVLIQFYGIKGVLAGTVASQMVFWIGRSYVVYSKCIKSNVNRYIKYWLRNGLYALLFLSVYMLCKFVYDRILIDNLILRFLAGGVVCEVIAVIFVFVVLAKLDAQKRLVGTAKGFVLRKKIR